MNERIKLDAANREKLFGSLALAGASMDYLSGVLELSSRTIRDWRRGKYTIPKEHFAQLLHIARLSSEDLQTEEIGRWWYTSSAGKLGGQAYIAKYITLGTKDSRKIGGYTSYARRKDSSTDIFARRLVLRPDESVELAEFIGIMIGDGTVARYQSSIALDRITDKDYILYVASLVEIVFGLKPTIQDRPKYGCVSIVLNSTTLTDILIELGLPRGHKLRAGLDIPDWILDNEEYSIACIRGIFDTDGSIFQEVHKYKDRKYAYPRLMLVSMSPELRQTVADGLNHLGIRAVIRSERAVSIERFTDIQKYFRIVGSSNPKHLRRYTSFGGVG